MAETRVLERKVLGVDCSCCRVKVATMKKVEEKPVGWPVALADACVGYWYWHRRFLWFSRSDAVMECRDETDDNYGEDLGARKDW